MQNSTNDNNNGWRMVAGKKVWKQSWESFDSKHNKKPVVVKSGFRYKTPLSNVNRIVSSRKTFRKK
jgi:hypothetical protein